MLFFQVRKEKIENSIIMTTKLSLRLFHTLHGISKQSNLEGISEANLIHPTAQSGAKFRSDWEYFQGGRLHSIAGQLVPLLDHPCPEKNPPFLYFYASSIEACSSMLVYPCYLSILPRTGCIWAPCFSPGTLHSFYPAQTQA